MRQFLKIILKFLSKVAIKKHGIELVVVTGWTGVELVKEGIYSLINEKFIVRRNIKEVWWDFSLPLNILGYDDKQRSISQWLSLIFKVIFVLTFGPRNKHTLILSAHSEHDTTAQYWKEFILPDFLIIIQNLRKSKVTDNLIDSTKKKGGVIIYEAGDIDKKRKIENQFTYGKDDQGNVSYKTNKQNIQIEYKKNKITIPNELLPPFARNIVSAIVSFGICIGLSFDDINGGLLKFDLRSRFLKEIVTKIDK